MLQWWGGSHGPASGGTNRMPVFLYATGSGWPTFTWTLWDVLTWLWHARDMNGSDNKIFHAKEKTQIAQSHFLLEEPVGDHIFLEASQSQIDKSSAALETQQGHQKPSFRRGSQYYEIAFGRTLECQHK